MMNAKRKAQNRRVDFVTAQRVPRNERIIRKFLLALADHGVALLMREVKYNTVKEVFTYRGKRYADNYDGMALLARQLTADFNGTFRSEGRRVFSRLHQQKPWRAAK